MPRHMLYSNEMDSIVTKHLNKNSDWMQMEILVALPPLPDGINVIYFYNASKNAVVIPSPLATKASPGDAAEPTYEATVNAISTALGKNKFIISTSLVGQGTGERHYVALYRSLEGEIRIFDSKISNPEQFLNSSETPGFFAIIRDALTALFNAFGLWAFGAGKQVHATFLNQDISIHRLGTQPLFDGVSCGLHSTGAVLAMADLINNDITSSKEISTTIINGEGLDTRAENILNDEHIRSVPSALGSISKSKGVSGENNSNNQDTFREKPPHVSTQPEKIELNEPNEIIRSSNRMH